MWWLQGCTWPPERGKRDLRGSVSSTAQVFRDHGLEVVHDPIEESTLACEHYNVLCWPVKVADQSDIAQKIANTVCVEDLPAPIPV